MEEVQRGWVKHPFRNMVVKAAKGGGYKIYCKFKKISCAKCEYGRANQRCIRKWCAKCCKKKEMECKVHKYSFAQKRKAAAITK